MPISDPASFFPLTKAQLGTTLMVADVTVEGVDADRLQAMGFCRGRRIELVKAGDPLIVRVLGSRVGLAGRLAAEILVCHTTSSPHSPADGVAGQVA